MRKVFILSTLILSFIFGANSAIEIKQAKLKETNRRYKKLNRKLSQIAKDILSAKRELKRLNKKLKSLERKISKSQKIYDDLNRKKLKVDEKLEVLSKEIRKKQDKFISLIADKFSIALVLEELKQPTPKSIMLQEAYKIYAKENSKRLESLKKEIDKLKQKEEQYIKKQEELKKEIEVYQKDRDDYLAKKRRQEELLAQLDFDKNIYKKRFDEIKMSRLKLQEELRKLNIIKNSKEDEKVRSSKRRRARYRGKKTLSPLPNSKLIKRYGVYTDPVYNFKIFNKSITLKAPYRGAKVVSVLPGEVVFAEDGGKMLGKVVIIEHKNNMHTIYAKISRLAPGIKIGKKVFRGTVIGKVNSTLIFEVTKNNRHINPLKLIRL